ncbi:MAG: hypothetical protein HYZ90_04085 [Candidatus Omnitrophica bacterium]|nr:hypothetical protein [Candidatus Omnitrophota bacterium]
MRRRSVLPLSIGLLTAHLAGLSVARAEYAPKGKRDPFVPLVTEAGQRIHPPGLDEEVSEGVAGLSLQGIVWDPNPKAESYAVINGQVVREMDEIDGMKVVKIEPMSVTVLVEGQPHELALHQPEPEETKSP